MTLEAFVDWLAEQSGTSLTVDYVALELQGVERRTEVDVGGTMKGEMTLGRIAEFGLDVIGGGFAELTFERQGDGLLLTTREQADRNAGIRMYDVTELLLEMSRTSNRLNAWLGVPPRRWGEHRWGLYANDADGAVALVRLLSATVDVDSWRDNGGSVGQAWPVGGVLVVRQTPKAHARWRGFWRSCSRRSGSRRPPCRCRRGRATSRWRAVRSTRRQGQRQRRRRQCRRGRNRRRRRRRRWVRKRRLRRGAVRRGVILSRKLRRLSRGRRLWQWAWPTALVLLVAAGWWRSRSSLDALAVVLPGDFAVAIASHDGRVWLATSPQTRFADGRRWRVWSRPAGDALTTLADDATAAAKSATPPPAVDRLGLLLGSPADRVGLAVVPTGFVLAAAGLPLAWRIVGLIAGPLQRRRRLGAARRRTLCKGCGYDLRGTLAAGVGRCPECGESVVKS